MTGRRERKSQRLEALVIIAEATLILAASAFEALKNAIEKRRKADG